MHTAHGTTRHEVIRAGELADRSALVSSSCRHGDWERVDLVRAFAVIVHERHVVVGVVGCWWTAVGSPLLLAAAPQEIECDEENKDGGADTDADTDDYAVVGRSMAATIFGIGVWLNDRWAWTTCCDDRCDDHDAAS